MIKEKLLFYNDYSSINKKCFSCQQFNHIIEECPKLHFVPNIEKIIKRFNYPFLNERNPFPRKKKKFPNALMSFRKNKKNYQYFKAKLKTQITNVKEEDEDSSSQSSNEVNLEEKENDILSESARSNKKNLYQNSINSIGENHKISITKTLSEDQENKEMSSKNLMNSKGNLPANDYIPKKISDSLTKPLKKEDLLISSQITNTTSNQIHTNNKEIELDRVYSFKNYFPKYNIETILKAFPETLGIEKEINKKYVKKKYSSLQNYTFYGNDILGKFLNEAKTIRKNRKKSVNTPIIKEDNNNVIKSKSGFPAFLGPNPLKKKNYFSKNDQNKEEIKTFAELINTLVQNNRKSKIINK